NALRTWVRSRSGASSMMSARSEAQEMPASVPVATALSGADTRVLRIEHGGAEDLHLRCLAVHGGAGRQALPEALAPASEQRESHPAFELDRGRGGGHVAETCSGRLGCDELAAVAQTRRAAERTAADQLQPLRVIERGALRKCAPDEVALFLQQALEAEITGGGVAVELSGGHVPLLDAQGVERIETVGADVETRPRFEQRRPDRERAGGGDGDLVGELTRE